jgi:nucleoside 2-deoxyribosyltransferase
VRTPQIDEPVLQPHVFPDIDVLVLYSDDARTGAGSTTAMEATVFLALEETNQSYINSNVTQRLRLVHMEEVSYTETGVSMTDRDALKSTSDGILDNAHTLRNSHGADLVILLVESLENCGRAGARPVSPFLWGRVHLLQVTC